MMRDLTLGQLFGFLEKYPDATIAGPSRSIYSHIHNKDLRTAHLLNPFFFREVTEGLICIGTSKDGVRGQRKVATSLEELEDFILTHSSVGIHSYFGHSSYLSAYVDGLIDQKLSSLVKPTTLGRILRDYPTRTRQLLDAIYPDGMSDISDEFATALIRLKHPDPEFIVRGFPAFPMQGMQGIGSRLGNITHYYFCFDSTNIEYILKKLKLCGFTIMGMTVPNTKLPSGFKGDYYHYLNNGFERLADVEVFYPNGR